MHSKVTFCFAILGIWASIANAENAEIIADYKGALPVGKMDFEKVIIRSSEITAEAPPDLALPKLKELDFVNTKIGDVPESAFGGVENLEHLSFENSTIENLALEHFNAFEGLKRLHFIDVKVGGAIKKDSFNALKNLKCLIVSGAQIDSIEVGAFNGLENLERLDISKNNLKSITKEMLEPLKKLKHLNLSGNKIDKFSSADLPELAELTELNIEHNPVSGVELSDLQKSAPQLKKLIKA